jgi:hypothetical protein
MNRRSFFKLSAVAAAALLMPSALSALTRHDTTGVQFDAATFTRNEAQTIIIYLYGGPSELGANLTNFDDIQANSMNKYNESQLTKTKNNFWEQAGGEYLEDLLASEDLNLFRTCYRVAHPTRSHGICTAENQRGLMNVEAPTEAPGIIATLGAILHDKGAIDDNTILPFITMEGDSGFFFEGDQNIASYLKSVAMDENFSNPYSRSTPYDLYTSEEWNMDPRPISPSFDQALDAMAQSHNRDDKLKEAFAKRAQLDSFIRSMEEVALPEGVEYPNNVFARKLEAAIKIMSTNTDTKVVSLGTGGLGGWDDHSNAIDRYTRRKTDLTSSLKAAMAHLKALNKDNVNIIVYSEFGRNVNLNDSNGWDHGNNQNVMILGGARYFNHVGIVGETQLQPTGSLNRLYLEPTAASYQFEPYSIAATIYKIYGITNPSYLTQGYDEIGAGLFK